MFISLSASATHFAGKLFTQQEHPGPSLNMRTGIPTTEYTCDMGYWREGG